MVCCSIKGGGVDFAGYSYNFCWDCSYGRKPPFWALIPIPFKDLGFEE